MTLILSEKRTEYVIKQKPKSQSQKSTSSEKKKENHKTSSRATLIPSAKRTE
jgi:hypothetical protein